MARCRLIRPEFYTHIELYRAERDTGLPLRVAFSGLWCVADREGRFEWKPEILKLAVLPFDTVDFEVVLMALCEAGFIQRYAVSGKVYGLVPTFTVHQKPHHREPPSRLPAPPSEKAPEKPGPGRALAVPRLTDTETDTESETDTEAVAVTESDTEVKASANLPRTPFSALGPNGGESPEEKRIRMKAGLKALMRGSATAGNPGVAQPEIVA